MRRRATFVRPLGQRVAVLVTLGLSAVSASSALTFVIVAWGAS